MDGNRRWAQSRGLASWEGHRAGYDKFGEVLAWSKEAGIQTVVAYAFSTENWKRSPNEVGHILDLFRLFLCHELEETTHRARVRFAGDRTAFPEDIQEMMGQVEERTSASGPCTVVVAASYGGRAEILRAARILQERTEEVSERSFASHLWVNDIPDPDMIIRTGGERRLSNFLLWHAAYSELFFTDTLWPDLTKDEFAGLLREYAGRKRNFGA